MRTLLKHNAIRAILLLLLLPIITKAQENIGMASGNYAGISGVWYNPASIADSRIKYDINLIGINYYFNNNFLLVKNETLVRRLLFKPPYNGSYPDVKKDLIQQQAPTNAKVFGITESNFHLPLSFMLTIDKKSAIAFTANNRIIQKIDSMPVDLAKSFYNELADPSLFGKQIKADSMQYNFLNWQEIGITYSRVVLNSDHHFLKLGFTAKWMGANAGAYIQTDKATLSFKDSKTLSLQSPLIHYARTQNADLDQFKRIDLFSNMANQAFGWDAGLVYEYRAHVKKFKYVDVDFEEESRRDLNKYMFRVGLSIVDMGKFTLQKKELTNDHSANIVNWDFSNVKANNFSDWDTAYSKQVVYKAGASKTFTYRLPSAMIANFDLHLFQGIYINVAAKAPFESFKVQTDTYIAANRWVAITPRYESKFLGVYIPIIRQNNDTKIGATVKLGPVYLGSNNLAAILSNPTSYEADFHGGVRLTILYGKPNEVSKFALSFLAAKKPDTATYATQRQIESLQNEVNRLRNNLMDTALKSGGVRIFINNNEGITSSVDRAKSDSLIIRNNMSDKQRQTLDNYNAQQSTARDTLIRQLAEKNLELEDLKQDQKNERSTSSKKNSKAAAKQQKSLEQHNKEMEKEMEKIRKQLVIQNGILAGGGTAAIIASSNNKKDSKEVNPVDSSKVGKDSVQLSAGAKTASVNQTNQSSQTTLIAGTNTAPTIIHDTLVMVSEMPDETFKTVKAVSFDPVFFATGSTVVNASDKERIQQLAEQVKQNADWRVVITGMTDETGSVMANRKVAAARCNAVGNILLKNGVNDTQLIIQSKLADSNKIPLSENPRRVVIRILSK